MGREPLHIDELIDGWTLLAEERELVAGKQAANRLAFALLLKFFTQHGRFPRGRSELPDEAVDFVARQVDVPASELGFYEWTGRTIEYHRAQIRRHLGFRECSVADADKLAAWLAAAVCERERRADLVREELLAQCRAERIEPPTAGRLERIMRSALRSSERTLTGRIVARLSAPTVAQLEALVAVDEDAEDSDADDADATLLARIKEPAGNVSLDTVLVEIGKLSAVRAIGFPPGLFEDVSPRVLEGVAGSGGGGVPVAPA